MTDTPTRELDDLYTVAPGKFVQARNVLAKRLRDAGRTAEAVEVSRQAKPAPPVWAINQVARHTPESLARFLAAVDELKRAHLRAPGDLAQATRERREALDRLLQTVSRVLGEGGFRPSPALLGRVSATLLGAAADPAVRKELKAGRLARELEAPGFDLFADAPRPSLRPSPASRSREDLRTKKTLERVRAEASERRRQAAELEHAAKAHRDAADKAAQAVKEIAEQLRQARQRASAESRAAAQAERAARQARAKAGPAGPPSH